MAFKALDADVISRAGGAKAVDLGKYTYVNILNPEGTGTNLLFQGASAGAARIHIEPNGNVDSGVTAKLDFMFDPFDDDSTNYRIVNIYTHTGDPNSTGEPAIAYFGGKSAGNHWPMFPSIHFGFGDDGSTGIPMKLHLIDHSADQFYTPAKGGWREGMAVEAGDYVTTLSAGVGRVYQADSTGTCGSTAPTHGTGTESDGAVDWTFVRQISSGNVRPVVVFGDRDDMPLLGHSTNRVQFLAPFLLDYGVRQNFLREDETDGAWFWAGKSGSDEWLYLTTEGGGYIRTHMTTNYWQPVGMARTAAAVAATDGDTTPSVAGVETLVLNNSSATVITALDDGIGSQRVRLVSNNANTTININTSGATSGGKIRSAKGADIAMVVDGAIDLERHPTANFWRVVGVGY